MKKVVYGVLLIAVFGLTACGNDKKETSSSSKVEQLESRVKELESSSSLEEPKENKEKILSSLTSDTNKKITKAFLDSGLEVKKQDAVDSIEHLPTPSDEVNNQNRFISQMGLQTAALDNTRIDISTYETIEDLNNAEVYYSETYGDVLLAKNENILSLMFSYKGEETENIFNKYKEVFEQIK